MSAETFKSAMRAGDVRELQRGFMLLAERLWKRTRFRVGSWLMGGEWYEVVMCLWVIRERAMRAVDRDGRVLLAECESLADALYAPIPGRWAITVTEITEPATAPTTQCAVDSPSTPSTAGKP
jgi:hypothetical protein